jgi:transposase-like protein
MPWRELSKMSRRKEFVSLAQVEGSNVRELCRRFGISPTTWYKWLSRFRSGGETGLAGLPRRLYCSPRRTRAEVEELVLKIRDAHPASGGRMLRAWQSARGHELLPSPSTITTILRRHGWIDPSESAKQQAWQRFERQIPNELWQMDFTG